MTDCRPLTEKKRKQLLMRARKAMKCSYSPYSRYSVGAALLSADGRIFAGTNVENASFGATVCAERSAVAAAVAAGIRKFKAIAITSDGAEPPVPCGICLQVLAEFCDGKLLILLGGKSARHHTCCMLKDLLPQSFKFTPGLPFSCGNNA